MSRNAILLRPQWVVTNQLTLPLVSTVSGKPSVRGLIQFTLPITIFLDTLFDDKAGQRSLQDDQFRIFKSVEATLAATGVDGKACLLRTICEMQENPIGEFTIIGEILTVLLTPKRGINDFLHEYLEAERIGQSHNLTCGGSYPKCPVSLFNMFKMYSTPADRPTEQHIDKEKDYDYHNEHADAHDNEQHADVLVEDGQEKNSPVDTNELQSSEDNGHVHW